jgi:N4-gp56 family major capsid protein
MIFGQDAYGVVDVENSAEGKPSIIVKNAGSAGTADPLNQRSTIGWKALFTAVILILLYRCLI